MTNPSEATHTPTEIRTIALATIAGVFFGGVATGVAFPTLPLLDEVLGISAIMLGIILSANRFARMPMNAPAGNIIDRVGARRPMILGLVIQGLGPFGYTLGLYVPNTTFVTLPVVGDVSSPAVVFLVARAAWGIGSAFVFIGAFATITYVTTRNNRGRWLGYMRGGQSLGFPTGLVVGGLVSDLFSIQDAFLLAGVLAMFAAVVAFVVLPDIQPDTDRRARIRDIPRMIRREPRILPLGIGNLAIRFVFGGLLLATVAQFADHYGLELFGLQAAGISGVVLAVGVLCSSSATVISGRISDRLANRIVLTVPGLLTIAGGLAVMALFPSILGLFAATAMIGLGTGSTGPALLATVGDITPGDEIGRMGGVYNVLGDIGLATGALLPLPMANTWLGFPGTYVVICAGVLVTLVVVAVPLLHYDAQLDLELVP